MQEMIPHRRVRVTSPTFEHQGYLDALGRIVDVRDYPPQQRFCQVELDGQGGPIWFELTELTAEQNTKGRTNDEEAT